MNAASVLRDVSAPKITRDVPLEEHAGKPILGDHEAVRAQVVAEFRRLADELESGELRGASIQWREDCTALVTVEVDSYDLAHPEVRIERRPIPSQIALVRGKD